MRVCRILEWTCDLVLHKALLKGCGGMSCSQRAKLSILLVECTGGWSDSSQRLWRRSPGWWRSRTESGQSWNTKERHDVWIENVLLGCAQDTLIIKNNLYEPHARVVHVKSEDTTLRRLTNWQRLARHWEKCVHLPSLTREFILCKKEILCEKMLQKKESKEKRRWWRRDYSVFSDENKEIF